MSSNWSVDTKRPSVLTLIVNARVGGRRRLVDRSGRDLQIGGLQCRDDFAGRQAAGRHLVRIEPNTHRVVAGAEHVDVADPSMRVSTSFT